MIWFLVVLVLFVGFEGWILVRASANREVAHGQIGSWGLDVREEDVPL